MPLGLGAAAAGVAVDRLQADYLLDSNMLGIVVAFVGILVSLFVTLSLASRLDRTGGSCGGPPATTSAKARCRGSSAPRR